MLCRTKSHNYITKCSTQIDETYTTDLQWFRALFDLTESRKEYCLIAVRTSHRFGSGTEAKVWIRLHAKNGDSRLISLEGDADVHLTGRKLFQRGQTDVFVVIESKMRFLDDVHSVEIGHDESGPFPVWHLEWVAVLQAKTLYTFPCRQWIGQTSYRGVSSLPLKCQNKIAIKSGEDLERTLRINL